MVNKFLKRSVSIGLALALSVPMFGGCKSTQANTSSASGKAVSGGQKLTLTEWYPFTGNLVGAYTSYEDVPFFQNLEKATGVHIKFISPPVGQEKEAFSLMMASGNLPDLISYSMFKYSGGPTKALKDGLIIPLNKYLDKDMPDLRNCSHRRFSKVCI